MIRVKNSRLDDPNNILDDSDGRLGIGLPPTMIPTIGLVLLVTIEHVRLFPSICLSLVFLAVFLQGFAGF